MANTHDKNDQHAHGSLKSYVIGFVLSIILTLIPLVLVLNNVVEGSVAKLVLLVTAFLQFAVQLVFFMHLREEKKPRYNFMSLVLGVLIALTIVGGSIWIMTYNTVAH